MKELFILIAHLLTTLVRLAQPGGVPAVAACMFRPDQGGKVCLPLRQADWTVQPGRRWGLKARD